MDLNWYKNDVKTYKDEFLKEQYSCLVDTRELCWDNAEDSYAEERERWLEEYNVCTKQLDILESEMERRNPTI